MIPRALGERLGASLAAFPVVALLGPRQVGKTTLALEVAARSAKPSLYLDLERPSDLNKLSDAEAYLRAQLGRLVIIDEVQRRPDLFPLLRSLVDERIRGGEPAGQFLVLGSASRDLLRQSSESLAGRIRYLELKPFSLSEVEDSDGAVARDRRWLRGGFPASYLAAGDGISADWRESFIATYLERDIPQLGPRLPAEQMRRFWSMLAHDQGNPWNASRLAQSLGVSANTASHYLDVLTDLYMIRRLRPWSGNLAKRLVKAPKTYVRDSGLLHQLLNIRDLETLLGHPGCGASWEGFVIETLLAGAPDSWAAHYFRTAAQAEIDLILEGSGGVVLAIEIKRSLAPALSKGFLLGCDDVGATRRLVVTPGGEAHPLGHDTEAVPLSELVRRLEVEWSG